MTLSLCSPLVKKCLLWELEKNIHKMHVIRFGHHICLLFRLESCKRKYKLSLANGYYKKLLVAYYRYPAITSSRRCLQLSRIIREVIACVVLWQASKGVRGDSGKWERNWGGRRRDYSLFVLRFLSPPPLRLSYRIGVDCVVKASMMMKID